MPPGVLRVEEGDLAAAGAGPRGRGRSGSMPFALSCVERRLDVGDAVADVVEAGRRACATKRPDRAVGVGALEELDADVAPPW